MNEENNSRKVVAAAGPSESSTTPVTTGSSSTTGAVSASTIAIGVGIGVVVVTVGVLVGLAATGYFSSDEVVTVPTPTPVPTPVPIPVPTPVPTPVPIPTPVPTPFPGESLHLYYYTSNGDRSRVTVLRQTQGPPSNLTPLLEPSAQLAWSFASSNVAFSAGSFVRFENASANSVEPGTWILYESKAGYFAVVTDEHSVLYPELEPALHAERDPEAYVWKYALRSSWVTVVFHYAPSSSQPDPLNFKLVVDATEQVLANFQDASLLTFNEPVGVKGAHDLYFDDFVGDDRSLKLDFFEDFSQEVNPEAALAYAINLALCYSLAFPHLFGNPQSDVYANQELFSVYTREFGLIVPVQLPQLVGNSSVELANYTALNWYERRKATTFTQFARAQTVWTATSPAAVKAVAVRTVAVAHATTLLSRAHSRPLPLLPQPAWRHEADADEIVAFFMANPAPLLEPDAPSISNLLDSMPGCASALRNIPLSAGNTLSLTPLTNLSPDEAYVYVAYLPVEEGAVVQMYDLLNADATVLQAPVLAAMLIVVKVGSEEPITNP